MPPAHLLLRSQAYHRALETASGSITKDLEKAIDKMNTFNAWEIDAEAKRLLNAVGIPEKMLGMPVSKVRLGVGGVGKCVQKCGCVGHLHRRQLVQ